MVGYDVVGNFFVKGDF